MTPCRRRYPALFHLPVLVTLLTLSGQAAAQPVYGETAALSGMRDNYDVGGLTGANKWSSGYDGEWQIELWWEITPQNGGYEYSYTWSEPTDNGDLSTDEVPPSVDRISHFTVDISDDCLETEDCATNANAEEIEYGEFFGDIEGAGALKLDDSKVTYTFDSGRKPVWGDLCLKDGAGPGGGAGDNCSDLTTFSDTVASYSGNTTLLWNTGFGIREDNDIGGNIKNYIARPDTVNGNPNGNGDNHQVPTPGSLALWAAAGVAALVRVRRS